MERLEIDFMKNQLLYRIPECLKTLLDKNNVITY